MEYIQANILDMFENNFEIKNEYKLVIVNTINNTYEDAYNYIKLNQEGRKYLLHKNTGDDKYIFYYKITKFLIKIKPNKYMTIKNDFVYPMPKTERQANILYDKICSLLKDGIELSVDFKYKKRYYAKRRKGHAFQILDTFKKEYGYEYYYRVCCKKPRFCMVKAGHDIFDRISKYSDNEDDVHYYASPNDIANMKRKLSKHRFIDWSGYQNKIDCKRFNKKIKRRD